MSSCIQNYNQEMVKLMEKRTHQLTIYEYRNDIHDHLIRLDFELEENPGINPLRDQVKILRSSILNSLFDICFRLSWSSSTFALSVHLFDLYTSKKNIEIINCRLIGFCCLWIASKYNENKPKGNILNALIKRSGYENPNIKSNFLKIEFDILKTIDWDLSYPTPELFIDLFLNTNEPNNLERRLGSMFLSELALFNLDIVEKYSSSSIAASSIMITNFAMLNLRHKHIRQHRFDDLESLILIQVVKLELSIKSKYLDNKIISHSNNNMVIHNLIYLAQCFVKQKEEEKQQQQLLKQKFDLNSNIYYNSILNLNSSFNENSLLPLPISPMASPTNLPNNSFIRCTPQNSNNNNNNNNNSNNNNNCNNNYCNGANNGNFYHHHLSHQNHCQLMYTNHNRSQSQDIDYINTGNGINEEITDINGKRSRSQSLSTFKNILPTPGTTPTASFNWINGNPTILNSASSSNIHDIDSNQTNNSTTNSSCNNSQIFTPVQLIPSALLYHQHSHSHSHSLLKFNSLRENDELSENFANKRVRQKYQRTFPVITRSRTKITDFSDNIAQEPFDRSIKRRHM